MSKRFPAQAAAVAAVAACFLLLPIASAAAAPSPWWQIVTGSRPTNLWEPTDNVQEIEVELGEAGPFVGAAARIEVGGTPVGCLGSEGFPSEFFCPSLYGFPLSSNASQLEAALESALGPAVEVTGGPVGGEPFKVTVPGSGAPPITFFQVEEFPFSSFGEYNSKVLSPGGSGRLGVTLVNLGNAPLDATTTPLTIVDQLPEGVEALGVQAFAGAGAGSEGLVDCELEAPDLVSCVFEDELSSYEAIEIDVMVNLTGEPPVEGAPGKVTVSGGNAPPKSATQKITVSPEETSFGIEHFSTRVEEEGGGQAIQAGAHPFQLSTAIQFNAGQFVPGSGRSDSTVEQPAQPRNLRFPLPAGFVGNATTAPTCSLTEFYEASPKADTLNLCPDASAVGAISALVVLEGDLGFLRFAGPVFNLPPAIGQPARLGVMLGRVPTVIDTEVDPDNEYRIIASVKNASQTPKILSASLAIWGTPGDTRHDGTRGWGCVYTLEDVGPCERPGNLNEDAFLRQPVSCGTPLEFKVEAEQWNVPFGTSVHETFGGPSMSGCNQIPFDPEVTAAPTSKAAGSSSGLDFQLNMPNAGLLSKEAIAEGQAKKVEVTLPEGVTVNPSQAEGLAACSTAEYAAETVNSLPGHGCPEASKVGSVQVSTPLLNEEAKGSLYVAKPYDNPFGSLLALYMVAKIRERGILIKQAGKVALDPNTGRIVSTFDDLPQVPFDTFKLHFFAGGRAPLVTPAKCNPPNEPYEIVAKFTPWHASNPYSPLPNEVITRTSAFTVDRGPNGKPCPNGTPPFNPGFTAGTINNAAGSYSPFTARLTRDDGEQEFSRFSMKFPAQTATQAPEIESRYASDGW